MFLRMASIVLNFAYIRVDLLEVRVSVLYHRYTSSQVVELRTKCLHRKQSLCFLINFYG